MATYTNTLAANKGLRLLRQGCPAFDIVSQGDSISQARTNLREAIGLFVETASADEIERRLKGEVYVTQIEVAVG